MNTCPACGAKLEASWELGSALEEALEVVRIGCRSCRAILRANYRLSYGAAAGRGEPIDPPAVVVTGAFVSRTLEPLERRAREGDLAFVLNELRSWQRDPERPFLMATEWVQSLLRGHRVALMRHGALRTLYRASEGTRKQHLAALFGEGLVPRIEPVRLRSELPEDEGVSLVLPPPGTTDPADCLVIPSGTSLRIQGASAGDLHLTPPPPKPVLQEWGHIDVLLCDLNLIGPVTR